MSALFSDCGSYRYRLTRSLNGSKGSLLFVGLNPSTADATHNDPTIRRCIGFAESWGHRRLVVVNLFAFRATHPADLKSASHPIGPDNDRILRDEAALAETILLGWGVHGSHRTRDQEVLHLLSPYSLSCLGRTKAGQPRHPLYLRADTVLEPYERK